MPKSLKQARITDTLQREGIAKRLYDLRMDTANKNHQKMTQEEVAERLSKIPSAKREFVSKKTISSWETGTTEPGIDQIVGLAELFNTTCDYLMTGTESVRMDAARRYGLSNEALRVLEKMNTDRNMAPIVHDMGYRDIVIYVKPNDFINAIITSQAFWGVSFSLTNYIIEKTKNQSTVKDKHNTDEEFPEDFDQFEMKYKELIPIMEALKENPLLCNMKIVESSEYLLALEYKISNLWSAMFKEIISNPNLYKKGENEWQQNSIPRK